MFSNKDGCGGEHLTATLAQENEDNQTVKLEANLQQLSENCEVYQQHPDYMKTIDYYINDYQAN